jgi:hypothetical protein
MMYVGRPVEAGRYIKGSKEHPKGLYMGDCDLQMGTQPCWATSAHAHRQNKQIVEVPDGHWLRARLGRV